MVLNVILRSIDLDFIKVRSQPTIVSDLYEFACMDSLPDPNDRFREVFRLVDPRIAPVFFAVFARHHGI